MQAKEAKAIADAATTGRWKIALDGILRRVARRALRGESSMYMYRFLWLNAATKLRIRKELKNLGYQVWSYNGNNELRWDGDE